MGLLALPSHILSDDGSLCLCTADMMMHLVHMHCIHNSINQPNGQVSCYLSILLRTISVQPNHTSFQNYIHASCSLPGCAKLQNRFTLCLSCFLSNWAPNTGHFLFAGFEHASTNLLIWESFEDAPNNQLHMNSEEHPDYPTCKMIDLNLPNTLIWTLNVYNTSYNVDNGIVRTGAPQLKAFSQANDPYYTFKSKAQSQGSRWLNTRGINSCYKISVENVQDRISSQLIHITVISLISHSLYSAPRIETGLQLQIIRNKIYIKRKNPYTKESSPLKNFYQHLAILKTSWVLYCCAP